MELLNLQQSLILTMHVPIVEIKKVPFNIVIVINKTIKKNVLA